MDNSYINLISRRIKMAKKHETIYTALIIKSIKIINYKIYFGFWISAD